MMPNVLSLKRGDQVVEIETEILSTDVIRRTFKVDPAGVWLRSEEDNKAFYPNESGQFRLDGALLYGCVLTVEGPELQPIPSFPAPSRTVSSTASSGEVGASASFRSTPSFKSVIPSRSGKEPTVSVKVIRAKMEYSRSGKVNFEQLSQMHIEMSEKNANVAFVVGEMRKRWGDEYRLVTVDGLELEDCVGNRGLKFWKQPRRKLYAVTKGDMRGKKKRPLTIYDSDEEEMVPSRRSCHDPQFSDISISVEDIREDIESMDIKLDQCMQTIDEMKMSLNDVLLFSRGLKVPFWLKRMFRQSFGCKICLTVPIKPPVIMSKCCKSVIGCERCVNNWYSGSEALTKSCPSCRAERGYSETLLLRGLDEFLLEAKAMMQDTEMVGPEDDS